VNRKTTWLPLALLLASLLPAAQDPKVYKDLPAEIQPFWERYWPAKEADDEDGMDKAVRMFRDHAERLLDILLDDYCIAPNAVAPDEMRALAWSLDRVNHQTRYIDRVRRVLDLDAPGRQKRIGLMRDLYAAEQQLDEAGTANTDAAWAKVGEAFHRASVGFESSGEVEFALMALKQEADIEQRRNRQWERALIYKHMSELLPKLSYADPLLEEVTLELERLVGQGFDPDKPKPEPGASPPGAAGAADKPDAGRGRTLESYAKGSTPVTVKLTLEIPRKGLAPVVLPTFAPLEDEYLWFYSWIEGPGPVEFDTQRSVHFAPGGKGWRLLRDEQQFGIDSDGDGTAELMFSPTGNPQRIDVPLPSGGTWPLMVAVPGDREQMFGMDVNYSPQPASARLRFHLAAAQRAEVLGETWLVYDNNLTGVYGDVVDEWGDGFTPSTAGEEPFFRDPDAVLIGKARVAQPWSTVLPLADGFWRAAITPDGGEVTLRKLDLEAGTVKLDCATKAQPTHILIEEVGGELPGAVLNVVPPKKGDSVPVPAGKWQFVFGRLESGTKTGLQQVRIYRGRAQPFEVQAGQTSTLLMGAPYALRLRPTASDIKTEEGETQVKFDSLRTFGRGGEEYTLIHDDPLQPEVVIIGADGKKLGKPQKTMRADISLWQVLGERCLYFPAPLVVSELKGGPFEFRLSQKSHSLLGGPFLPEEAPKPAADKGKP